MSRLIKICHKNKYLIGFTLSFFLIYFATNIKTFLLCFILSFILFFFILKANLFNTVFYLLLLSLPFENNIREWVVYPAPVNLSDGYTFVFGISPKIVLGFLLLLIFLASPKRSHLKEIKWSKKNQLLLLFFLLTAIGSLFFQTRTTTVFMGFIRICLSLGFYFFASAFFSQKTSHQIFKSYIIALTIFITFLGFSQLIKQRPIGKFIELTPSFSKSGYYTTDGVKQYRVSSFISHPVYFGSFLSILIPIIIGFFWQNFKKIKNVKLFYGCLAAIGLTILVLLGALSRSTWITLALIFCLFFLYNKIHPILFPPLKLPLIFKRTIIPLLILAALVPIIILLVTRIKSVTDFNGSIYSRVGTLIQMKSIPLPFYIFGLGLNNYSFELSQPENSSYFATPPHNTFLIFLTELGLPTTLVFILFIWFSLFIKKPLHQKPFVFGVWIGLLTFLISAQFHPLFNLDPTFDLFMLTMGFYSACQPKLT